MATTTTHRKPSLFLKHARAIQTHDENENNSHLALAGCTWATGPPIPPDTGCCCCETTRNSNAQSAVRNAAAAAAAVVVSVILVDDDFAAAGGCWLMAAIKMYLHPRNVPTPAGYYCAHI